MEAKPAPKNEILGRIRRFQQKLVSKGVAGALIVQRIDLYYLSGTDQDAHLWVPAEGEPLLMVRKSLERAREHSPLEEIVPLRGLSQLRHAIGDRGGRLPDTLGLELDVLPAARYLNYRKIFPQTEIVDVSRLIRETRMVKTPFEIGCITRAARMADALYGQIPEFLMEVRREIDLVGKVESFYRTQGHPGVVPARNFNQESIYGHIMSGPRAAVAGQSNGPLAGQGLGPFFSQGAGMERIGRNEPILVDYGANCDGYIADQTRIFSLGELPAHLRQAYELAVRIQDTLAREGCAGVRAGDLYARAVSMAVDAGLADRFMGYPDPVPYVAHGVGLEIDELPVIGRNVPTVLAEGMVIAIEPKFVFPGEGVVCVENTFVVRPDGMERLNRFPDDIVVECEWGRP